MDYKLYTDEEYRENKLRQNKFRDLFVNILVMKKIKPFAEKLVEEA